MKKIIVLAFFVLLALLPARSLAATPATGSATTPTTSPSGVDDAKVKKIIDLVASSVAEQKLVAKIGILGTVNEATSTKITLTDTASHTQIVDIDEITKFSNPDNKNFGISDIKSGDYLGIIGLLNKGSDHILARFVDKVTSVPTYFDGIITSVDRINFQIHAVDESGKETVLDNQTSTKISSFTTDTGQIKSGFSKMAAGERVFAAGFFDTKIKNQLEVDRVIYFPDAPLSDKLKAYVTPIESPAASPSGVKPTITR